MGGYGSGGLNKTHGRVEYYRKVDSFAFYNYLNFDKYLQYKKEVRYPFGTTDIVYHVATKTASIDFDGYECPLGLSRVPNIDGVSVRMYFLCPECGKRVRYLYKRNGAVSCRTCSKLNYESQQKSGCEEILRKMRYIVEKQLEYPYWQSENPSMILPELSYIPKPRYMRWEKYTRLMREYKKLQEEYWGYELKSMARFMNPKKMKWY